MLNFKHNDLLSVYKNTVVNDDGVLAYVKNISEDFEFQMLADKEDYIKKFSNYEDLPIAPVIPYYINTNKRSCIAVVRKQLRRFKQGLHEENTTISNILDDGEPSRISFSDGLASLLSPKSYVDKETAIEQLIKKTCYSIAIDKQICLTASSLVLFKSTGVGFWKSDGKIEIIPSYQNVMRYNKCLQ